MYSLCKSGLSKHVIFYTIPYALTGSCQINFIIICKDTKLSILIFFFFFFLLVLSEIHLERIAKQKIDKPQGSTWIISRWIMEMLANEMKKLIVVPTSFCFSNNQSRHKPVPGVLLIRLVLTTTKHHFLSSVHNNQIIFLVLFSITSICH